MDVVIINRIIMWKFKKLERLDEADVERGEGLGMKMVAVFTNGTVDKRVSTIIEDKEQMERTLRVAEDRFNKRTAELASINIDTYALPPAPVEEPVVLTPEEIKANEIAQAETELEEEYQRAKRDKEITELAQTNPALAGKLSALEAVKNKK